MSQCPAAVDDQESLTEMIVLSRRIDPAAMAVFPKGSLAILLTAYFLVVEQVDDVSHYQWARTQIAV